MITKLAFILLSSYLASQNKKVTTLGVFKESIRFYYTAMNSVYEEV